ncbi:Putative prophage phiRv2 integrase [Paenibacillus sp. CECT 9249]|uniref:tyrosine-type recombinase/integrase n=1 Tax=Paenibacillus sp. CECT 9249 TaxID=2845385 RepID=UPI001E4E1741|nr:site-specific integrase [Paenibacillus sp. CECT 9249]CAH0118515.1 Putative prophage phiRv2 integrase [Paenibacillus sp. CECT 9249]
MPVYKDPRAQKNGWYYEIEAGKDPVTGKRRRRKKRGFRTKKEAERAMIAAKLELENQRNGSDSAGDVLYGDYARTWLARRRQLSGNTKQLYASYLKRHLLPAFGQLKCSEITSEKIASFLNDLYGKRLSDASIKRIFSLLHAMLQSAAKANVIVKNAASFVDKPAVKRREFTVWDIGQIRYFLRMLRRGGRYSIAIGLALLTGMRQGEILGLRWSDIDFEHKVARIRQTLSHDGRTFQPGAKTDKSVRVIALTEETIAWLVEHRECVIKERQEGGQPDEGNQPPDLVVCTREGKPVPSRTLYKAWRRMLAHSQLPPITFHDLRHTHASILLKQGVHPKIVSERLGHSSVYMTLDTYSHLLPHLQHEMVKPLDRLLFGQEKESRPDSSESGATAAAAERAGTASPMP